MFNIYSHYTFLCSQIQRKCHNSYIIICNKKIDLGNNDLTEDLTEIGDLFNNTPKLYSSNLSDNPDLKVDELLICSNSPNKFQTKAICV